MDKEKYTADARAFAQQWLCQPDGDIFFTHSSLLWPVTAAGEKLILKIANPDDDEAHAAELLRQYDGRGIVRLIKSHGSIQLLERISDGTGKPTLEQMALTGQADAVTQIICDTVAKLHAAAAPESPLKNLIPFRNRSNTMRKHVNEGRVKPEDRAPFKVAYDLCDELIAETLETQRPLHGDIHHGNILYSDERGWVAIDPKGIMGPRVYEYANSLCNPFAASDLVTQPTHMERQASIMSERAGLDKKLLLQFAFLHAMQCAAWSLFEPGQKHWMACGATAAKLADIRLA